MFLGIKMPKLSDRSDEYQIVGIRRNVGDAVEQGEIFMDVETPDKATREVAFYKSGRITEINVKVGDIVRSDSMLGVMDVQE